MKTSTLRGCVVRPLSTTLRRGFRIAAPVLLPFCWVVAPARATTIVQAEIHMDWGKLSFIASGGLVVDQIIQDRLFAGSSVMTRTFITSPVIMTDSENAVGSMTTTATSASATNTGTVQTFASTNNGVLTSVSNAATFGSSIGDLRAVSSFQVLSFYWFNVHGTGTLTMSIPYRLVMRVVMDSPPTGRDDFFYADTSITFQTRPELQNSSDNDSVSWRVTNPVSAEYVRDGILTGSDQINGSTSGSIQIRATAQAFAAVPDAGSTALMLGLSLMGLAAYRIRVRRVSRR